MTEDQDDDLDHLIDRLAKAPQDEEAWRLFYRQMRPFVLAVTFRKLRGNRELAEDATQEVFVRLARYRPFGKFKDSNAFRRYLYVVAQNTSTTYLSQILQNEAASRDGESYEEPAGLEEDPAGRMILDEMEQDILGTLDDRDRQIFGLLMKGYKFAEIVSETGENYASAGTRLYRLRGRLRKYLDARNLVLP